MCIGCPGNTSIFGNTSQYIKLQGSDFVAIEGVNTIERLIGGDLRFPYKQILKSRILLKSGQANYLLNHLGLGDNATFLAIKATYNKSSVNEEDNYINYSYYTDLSKINTFSQLLVLTGNSSHRIEQLYLTNPSLKYTVTLDVMVAIMDDTYSFFNDTLNQTGTSFTGLSYTDIASYIIGQSIVINDINNNPLIYLNLSNINSISRNSTIITIDDDIFGNILLVFNTEFDSVQAQSLLTYVLSNNNIDIANIDILDNIDPVIYLYSNIGNTASGYTISSYLTSSIPTYIGYTYSEFGYTFSTTLSLLGDGNSNIIDKGRILNLIIASASDNRDGVISITNSNINLFNNALIEVNSISTIGTYSIKFNLSDIAQNYLDGIIYLDIIL